MSSAAPEDSFAVAVNRGRAGPMRRSTHTTPLLFALSACSLINHFEIGDAGDSGARDGGVDATLPDAGDDAGAPADAGACATPCTIPTPLCDPTSRTCVECLAPADCDDDDLCTTDRCTLTGACENVLDTTCVSAVSTGIWHSCAWHPRNGVWCWGSNDDGQLGNDMGGPGTMSLRATTVPGVTDAIDVSAEGSQTCAVRRGGAVVCWGNGLDARSYHNCATRETGAVVCWGRDDRGQLGDGRTEDSATPPMVMGL